MTATKPRGILFMDAMVLEVQADRKTVTRRTGKTWARVRPGDRLWVRECHAFPVRVDDLSVREMENKCANAGYERPWAPTWYRADDSYNDAVDASDLARIWHGRGRWRPSIFMPRWACRTELEVVSVTVEHADAQCGPDQRSVPYLLDDAEGRREGFPTWDAFMEAWKGLHPGYNGIVYRVEFRRIT